MKKEKKSTKAEKTRKVRREMVGRCCEVREEAEAVVAVEAGAKRSESVPVSKRARVEVSAMMEM